MKSRHLVTSLILSASLAVLLTACGGGGGGGGGTTAGTGGGLGGTNPGTGGGTSNDSLFFFDTGLGGSGGLIGTIDRFGSVFVNGVEMETESSDFFVEGEPASESDLREGHYVVVVGDIEAGSADQVHYRSNLKGPVTEVTPLDAAAGRYQLTVLGQTVLTTPSTRFDGVLAASIVLGNELEISGAVDADGQLIATYIELKTALAEYKAVGTVASLDTGARTFTLGGLTVDYGTAQLSEFEGAALANGQLVEIKLAPAGFTPPSSAEATEVELLPTAVIEEGAEVELEGYIDRFVSSSDFSVGGVAVTTTGTTTFEPAGAAGQLALNVKVEVEGRAAADGSITAEKVELKSDNAIRVEGPVGNVDVTAGTVTALGLTFEVRSGTELEDDRDGTVPFTLDDLLVGDYVEVRGFLEGTTIVAVELERDDPDPRARLRGSLTGGLDRAVNSIEIQGVTVFEDGSTVYEDRSELNVDRDTFYDLLQLGTQVEVEWDNFSSTEEPADQLSLEDDD